MRLEALRAAAAKLGKMRTRLASGEKPNRNGVQAESVGAAGQGRGGVEGIEDEGPGWHRVVVENGHVLTNACSESQPAASLSADDVMTALPHRLTEVFAS